ncbi:hypothetical protein Desaci_3135 [Desulfosporosinus acidiphilus SJ4]|uniref:Uncharacterized protein n=1 Tax=Desulfosporosinus acidiphilus (strain DSM 22704 / JCM 16185 / SJ4) TaxID=646529 RepID=I4D8B5_DESAJ|nr:hypothetical protein [Desulfosporosinus acidiphilus]AFM42039.1 hypothetical protein Desaci_3135 [Desulfosporosinus acidiphilus SJ4]
MPNTWGRPPHSELWQDLQALALWIFIIGVVGYLLFPNFFKDIYNRLSSPVTQTSTLNDNYTMNGTTDQIYNNINSQNYLGQDYSNASSAFDNGKSEITSGFWIIFVADGVFKQLPVSSEAYEFLLRLIEIDKNSNGKNTVILASNGQIHKFIVSDEIYSIIINMAAITARSNS